MTKINPRPKRNPDPRPVDSNTIDWPSDEDKLIALNNELHWELQHKSDCRWRIEQHKHNSRMTDQKIARLYEDIAELEEKIENKSMFG